MFRFAENLPEVRAVHVLGLPCQETGLHTAIDVPLVTIYSSISGDSDGIPLASTMRAQLHYSSMFDSSSNEIDVKTASSD